MFNITNKQSLRFTLGAFVLLIVLGYISLTSYATYSAYKLATDKSLEQAARAYSVFYQALDRKASPSDSELEIRLLIAKLNQGIKGYDSGILAEYEVYLYTWEDNIPLVKSMLFHPNNINKKEEVVKKAKLNTILIDYFQERPEDINKNATHKINVSFSKEEKEELGGWSQNIFNRSKLYFTLPVKNTKNYIAITRSTELLTKSNAEYADNGKEALYLIVIFFLGTLGIVWIITRNLNRLLASEEKLKAQKWIEKGWHDFSHDIGTPLGVIQQSSQKIQLQSDSKIISQNAKYISEALDHIQVALNEQRVAARDGERREAIRESEIVNIKGLLYDVFHNSETEKKRKLAGIKKFHITVENSDIEIRVNRKSAMRAVQNLVNNAINATQKGGVIEASVTMQNQWLVIKISDTGEGLDEELDDILTNYDGILDEQFSEHGNGLVIVQKIMYAHEGELIKPRNRPDQQGVEVSIKFPLLHK